MDKKKKVALVTGCTGQDGSYLCELLLEKGYEVHGVIRRSSNFNTQRIDPIFNPDERKYIHYGDLAQGLDNLIYTIKPDEIYNLGSMSHVRVSFDVPVYTGDITGLAVCRLLECIHRGIESGILNKNIKYYQASSSEMFGQTPLPEGGYNESSTFTPVSPYGCAKLYGYHITRSYRTGYGIFASNGILFNHETMAEFMPVFTRQVGDKEFDIKPFYDVITFVDKDKKEYQAKEISDIEIYGKDKWVKVKYASAYPHDIKNDNKKPKIITGRCGSYFATNNHVAFLKTGEIETGKIKKGDKFEHVKLPKNLVNNNSLNEEEAYLLGMFVADGSYSFNGGQVKFTKNDEEIITIFVKLWENMGGTVEITKCPSGFKKGNYTKQLILKGKTDWLKSFDIYTSQHEKRIPKCILNSSNNIKMMFLKGYNKCDGLKKDKCKYEFKSFKTTSATLAQGLWYLTDCVIPEQRKTLNTFKTKFGNICYSFNFNSNTPTFKGNHLKKDFDEIHKIEEWNDYSGWFYDIETESGEFVSGVGNIHVHNSPRRGPTFVTRKITRAACRIALGLQDALYLGNLDAKRDWGHSKDYMKAIYAIMQHDKPDDFVVATGEQYTVKDFVIAVFDYLNLDWTKWVQYEKTLLRPNEVPDLLGNSTKIRKVLNWKPEYDFKMLVAEMVESDMEDLRKEIHCAENNWKK